MRHFILTALALSLGFASTHANQSQEKKPMNVKRITPVLLVNEIEPVIPFWVDRLGFAKTIEVPDGNKLALNRKSQVYWRKYYRGAYHSDVEVMDTANVKFTNLTPDFEGMDTWPMWSTDGHIYFVSDREGNGLTNIWRVPERGGKAERVTFVGSMTPALIMSS